MHLVLHLGAYDVRETDEPDHEEQEANAFAAAFLMPDAVFWREWGDTRGMGLVDRVLKVKRIFRVSYRTVLYRLSERYARAVTTSGQGFSGTTSAGSDGRCFGTMSPRALAQDAFRASFPEDNRAGEPEHLSAVDFAEDRLSRLVRCAIEDGRIRLGRGAEILGLSLMGMRDLAGSWLA